MVNTLTTLTERNKELLAKIEELEGLRKVEISREAQLKIIDEIEKWKKENYETGDRLKKHEKNIYPSRIVDNLTEDRPLWKLLAGHVNFELPPAKYLHKKENPLYELLEIMLDSITRNVISSYTWQGLEEKNHKEKETYYKELMDKKIKIDNLEEESKEKELLIEELKQENKVLELGREANLDAIGVGISFEIAKILPEIEKLEDKLDEKSERLQEFIDKLAKQIVETRKFRAESEGKDERIEELFKELEKEKLEKQELRTKLRLAYKPLPKPSKFEILKEKTKTKFRHLIEKTKQRSQELVARIEVKVK